jgi:hypothetical protein
MRAGHGDHVAAKTHVTMTAEVLRVKQRGSSCKNGYEDSTGACRDHERPLYREPDETDRNHRLSDILTLTRVTAVVCPVVDSERRWGGKR